MHSYKKILFTVFLLSLSLLFVFCNHSNAALCAFRNPDRDTYKLFPEATGYKTVIKTIDPEAKKAVEDYLGLPLDYDEGGEYTFYFVLKDEEVIGIIRPCAERGKYGIVEVVWALTLDGEIIDFIIQRSREKGTDKLKSEGFRSQFKGKTFDYPFTIPGTRNIDKEVIKAVEESVAGSSAIAYNAKKSLFLYWYFFPEYRSRIEEQEQQ